jgi:hypothetical protein
MDCTGNSSEFGTSLSSVSAYSNRFPTSNISTSTKARTTASVTGNEIPLSNEIITMNASTRTTLFSITSSTISSVLPTLYRTWPSPSTYLKAQSTALFNFQNSSNCSPYEQAVAAYCQQLISGEGLILSPNKGIYNDSVAMSNPRLLSYVFSLRYYPSEECSTYSNRTTTDADLAMAYHFEGKMGFSACTDLFTTDCCNCTFFNQRQTCFDSSFEHTQ